MKVIFLEFYKLRHKHLYLMATLLVLVEILWGLTAANTAISRNPLNAKWEHLILMISSLNSLFLPILTAICVSRICDMEHKGDTWKLLLSFSVRRGQLYFAKYICACSIMLWVIFLQIVTMYCFGQYKSFEQPTPILLLLQFFLGTILTSFAIAALQQWISLAIKNQAFSLSVGLIGAFIGLTSNLLPESIRNLFIWGYYISLSPVKQSFENEEYHFAIQEISTMMPYFTFVLIVSMLIFLAGTIHISRKEV